MNLGMEELKAAVELFSRGNGRQMFKDHPLPALLVIIATIGVTYLFTSSFYTEIIAVLEQRITAYKERLHDLPKESKYSKLTNRDLQKETYAFVSQLRDLGKKHQEILDSLPANGAAQTLPNLELNERFFREMTADLIALRKEMYTRLPKRQSQGTMERLTDTRTDDILASGFLSGTNPIGIVANELEQLAKALPTQSATSNWLAALRWQDGVVTFCVFTSLFLFLLRQYAKYRWEKLQRFLILALCVIPLPAVRKGKPTKPGK